MKVSIRERLLSKVKINETTGCWEWTANRMRNGYGLFWFIDRKRPAHRVSYELHCGPIPDGMHTLHHCDNRACINPAHLFIGTNADNMADKVSKGRQHRLKGIASGRAKLTEADVMTIRSSVGLTQREIGERFGITNQQVSSIRSGKRWSHLPLCLKDISDTGNGTQENAPGVRGDGPRS